MGTNKDYKELTELVGLNNSMNKFFLKIQFFNIRGMLLDMIYLFETLIQAALMLTFLVLIIIIPEGMEGILFIIPTLLIITHLIKNYIRKEICKTCDLYEETIDTVFKDTKE